MVNDNYVWILNCMHLCGISRMVFFVEKFPFVIVLEFLFPVAICCMEIQLAICFQSFSSPLPINIKVVTNFLPVTIIRIKHTSSEIRDVKFWTISFRKPNISTWTFHFPVLAYRSHQNAVMEGFGVQVLIYLIYQHNQEVFVRLIMTNYLYQQDLFVGQKIFILNF